MRGVLVILMVLISGLALAEQPRGTYTLDRGGWVETTSADGTPHPSCGGQKPYGGQATFIVEYGDKILVNGREWRFHTHTGDPGTKPRPDATAVIVDPDSSDKIWIWFRTDDGAATGFLSASDRRDGKLCVDAWELRGYYRK
jgi:hypothetical protein